MDEQRKSPTRTKATWKPRVDEADPCFLAANGITLLPLAGAQKAAFREPGRAPVAELPYQRANAEDALPEAEPLPLLDVRDLPAGFALDYTIVGGYDANAVQVSWMLPPAPDGTAQQPQWVMLKTFTGLQVKYPLPGKRAPIVFALADEDAYVYCDEPRCRECTFRCKQGFVLYVALADVGIVKMPLSPNQSTAGRPTT